MDIEYVRDFCLALPLATEDTAFGDDHLLFRLCDKIFACMTLDGKDVIALKCDPDLAIALRDRYPLIEPAFHWNKKYWNQIQLAHVRDTRFIEALIRHSYSQVAAKLTKRFLAEHPEIASVSGNIPDQGIQ